jgi:uncharacterized protein (TIGR00725 family)
MRPRYVSVIGQSSCDARLAEIGVDLGRRLAEAGCIVVNGGFGGVMTAVARGVREAGGVCIGVLPGLDREQADPDLTYSVCTGVGHARNLAVVASGDVVIALGGAWGTLSEIGMARAIGRRLILLESWEPTPPAHARAGELDGVLRASSADEAVRLAIVNPGTGAA